MACYDNPVDWLSSLPDGHVVDCVIGHGAILGRQVQVIKRHCNCKWIQVVHTAPEELGMFKSYTWHKMAFQLRGEKKKTDFFCRNSTECIGVETYFA